MYSKEEKIRFLGDFLESGLSKAAFCRQPGRPSKKVIQKCLKEAEQGLLEIPERQIRGIADKRAKHEPYPEKTKREAIRLCKSGMPAPAVARRLNVSSPSVVRSWLHKASQPAIVSPEKSKRGMRMSAEERKRIEELEAKIEEQQRSLDVLRELMCDPKAGDPASLSNAQKSELGERLRRERGWLLKDVLTFLKISKSSYEYAKNACAKKIKHASFIADRVRQAWEASGRIYGYRRVLASIASGADGGEPLHLSEHEVRHAMREGNMRGRRPRATKSWNSYTGESDNRPANIPRERIKEAKQAGKGPTDPKIIHDFSAEAPGIMVVTDVTEFKVGNAKAYLSPIIDCFDGRPEAWSISRHPDSKLTDSSLVKYAAARPKEEATVVHSDGGTTYRSQSWKDICSRHGFIRSMSNKGNCGDNARAEGFFGTLKEEFYHGKDWSKTTFEKFAEELDSYINWYRDGRLKAFKENGKIVYDTITGRREKLGYSI